MNLFLDACVMELLAPLCVPFGTATVGGLDLAYTPDLRREYLAKLERSSNERARLLTQSVLNLGSEVSFFGFSEEGSEDPGPCLGWDQGLWASAAQSKCIESIRLSDRRRPTGIPGKRTDAYLVAFAEHDLVVTNDTGGHWKNAPLGRGRVVQWMEFVEVLRNNTLADTVRLFAGSPQ